LVGIPAAKLNEDGEKMRVLGLPRARLEPSQLPPAENPATLSASGKEPDGARGELFLRIQLWIWKAFNSGQPVLPGVAC